LGWYTPFPSTDAAKSVTLKFKNLRKLLRSWNQTTSNLKDNTKNVKLMHCFLNLIKEFSDLTLLEWNFRRLLEAKLISLLEQQKAY